MTITVTNKATFNLMPGFRMAVYSVTLDSGYAATTGEAADLSAEFPSEVLGASVVDNTRRFHVSYRRATAGHCSTGAIMVYINRTNAGPFRAQTTAGNLASINFYMIAWGK